MESLVPCLICKKLLPRGDKSYIRHINSLDGNHQKDMWMIPVCPKHEVSFEMAKEIESKLKQWKS